MQSKFKRLISSSGQWPYSVKLYEFTGNGETTYSILVNCKGKPIHFEDGFAVKRSAFEEYQQQVTLMWEKFNV